MDIISHEGGHQLFLAEKKIFLSLLQNVWRQTARNLFSVQKKLRRDIIIREVSVVVNNEVYYTVPNDDVS